MNDNVTKRLKKSKTDAERVKLLQEIVELQQKEIVKLTTENIDLRNQIQDNEEIESITSVGSDLSQVQVKKRKAEILLKIQNSKTSTASERREIKYLKQIGKLKEQIVQKDLLVVENLDNDLVSNLEGSINELEQVSSRAMNVMKTLKNQIEFDKK